MKLNMGALEKKWMLRGAIAIAAVTLLILLLNTLNFLRLLPPIHVFVFSMFISFGYVLIMPGVYIILFSFLGDKKFFGKFVLMISIMFSILNMLYFLDAWKYGVKYQGEPYTLTVAVINIIGFLGVMTLAFLGLKRESKIMQYAANLLLFVLLSCFAFPLLGEV